MHLVSTGISWPALNQIVCALRFFYGVTLGEAVIPERICAGATHAARHIEPRRSRAISGSRVEPEVPGGAHLLLCGRIASLRSRRSHGHRRRQCAGVILVRHGNGAKDRNVMLSPQLLGISTRILAAGPATAISLSRFRSCSATIICRYRRLRGRVYWRLARPRLYLFPVSGPARPQ
jgi:integrase/recombinase XerD